MSEELDTAVILKERRKDTLCDSLIFVLTKLGIVGIAASVIVSLLSLDMRQFDDVHTQAFLVILVCGVSISVGFLVSAAVITLLQSIDRKLSID